MTNILFLIMNELEQIFKMDDVYCNICFNVYDIKKRCPRILTCGHSFCQACLCIILKDRKPCPNCNREITFTSVTDISINYCVKKLLEKPDIEELLSEKAQIASEKRRVYSQKRRVYSQKRKVALAKRKFALSKRKIALKINKLPLTYIGHCKEHNLSNHCKCNECYKFICGTCVVLDHNKCFSVLKIEEIMEKEFETINKMKTNIKEKIKLNKKKNCLEQKMEDLFNNLVSLEEDLTKLCLNHEYEIADKKLNSFYYKENNPRNFVALMSKKELSKQCIYVTKMIGGQIKYSKIDVNKSVIRFNKWENTTEEPCIVIDLFDFVHTRTTFCNTKEFFQKNEDALLKQILSSHPLKYGKISVETNGQIRIHRFETIFKTDISIDFQNFLEKIGCTSLIPTKIFMQITRKKMNFEELVIEIDDIKNPRSLDFLLSTSGLTGVNSINNFIILCCPRSIYLCESKEVIEGIKLFDFDPLNNEFVRYKKGCVSEMYSDSTRCFNFHKRHNTKDVDADKFGQVISGIQTIDIISPGVIIADMGFILNSNNI